MSTFDQCLRARYEGGERIRKDRARTLLRKGKALEGKMRVCSRGRELVQWWSIDRGSLPYVAEDPWCILVDTEREEFRRSRPKYLASENGATSEVSVTSPPVFRILPEEAASPRSLV